MIFFDTTFRMRTALLSLVFFLSCSNKGSKPFPPPPEAASVSSGFSLIGTPEQVVQVGSRSFSIGFFAEHGGRLEGLRLFVRGQTCDGFFGIDADTVRQEKEALWEQRECRATLGGEHRGGKIPEMEIVAKIDHIPRIHVSGGGLKVVRIGEVMSPISYEIENPDGDLIENLRIVSPCSEIVRLEKERVSFLARNATNEICRGSLAASVHGKEIRESLFTMDNLHLGPEIALVRIFGGRPMDIVSATFSDPGVFRFDVPENEVPGSIVLDRYFAYVPFDIFMQVNGTKYNISEGDGLFFVNPPRDARAVEISFGVDDGPTYRNSFFEASALIRSLKIGETVLAPIARP